MRCRAASGQHHRSPSVWAAAIFFLACLPYAATPWFEFVDYDDPDHVAGHAIVGRGLTARGVAWAFGFGTDPATDGWFNWPLTWLSHMADASLFGMWAGGHHVVSVLFHAVNAMLVLSLARRLGMTLAAAGVVAAVFAVHPAQVESVAWVSERKTVLCTCLVLLTLLAYLRWRDVVVACGGTTRFDARAVPWLVGWNVLGGLALLGKPLAVTLPCVLLLIDAITLGRVRGQSLAAWLASLARCLPEKIPLFAAVVGMCAWTVLAQSEAGAVYPLPLTTRLAHAVVAYATYLCVFLWPAGLGCFHPHPGMPAAGTLLAAGGALVAMSAIAIAAAVRGRPLPLFGWLWFLGTLVPMIGLIQVGGNGWSDRYLYLPIIGLAIGAVDMVEREGGMARSYPRSRDRVRWHSTGHAAVSLFMAAWIAVLSILAWQQTRLWRNTESLVISMMAGGQTSAEAWNMLAVFQARRGDLNSAEASFVEAISRARSPARRSDHLANLGRMCLDAGRDADAARAFAAGLETTPNHVAGRRGLGVALTRLGAEDRAAEVFRALLRERPRDAIAWVGLGNALYKSGRATDAAACYDTALELDPHDPPTLVNRAWARLEAGDRRGAMNDVTAALGLGHAPDEALREAVRLSTPGGATSFAEHAREGDEAGGGPGRAAGE